MKKLLLFFSAIFITAILMAQSATLTTTIRGTITDKQSQSPLPGATIVVVNSNPVLGATSDANGYFRLENVPVGRQSVQVVYLGYAPATLNNLLLNSGKELELIVQMEESIAETGVVEITAEDKKTESVNKMSTVSTRSFSIEEAMRYSGTLQDVSRMAQNYAGVSNSSDDRNDIIIRGNSPTGVLWRLEGIDIPSPNHFSTLGTTGGPISLLNVNNLAKSDFSTSAFASEYGNALGGVFDLKMRSGNKDKREFTGQIGFNGFELGAEGPFKKGSQASYMINYRYSVLGVLSALGVNFGTGSAIPQYSDLTFKVDLPTSKAGRFTIFGIGGNSFIDFKADTSSSNQDNLYSSNTQNSQFHSQTGIMGMSHTYFFNEKTFGKLIVAASTSGTNGYIDSLSTANKSAHRIFGVLQDQNRYSAHYLINSKINAKNTIKSGIIYDYFKFNIEDSVLINDQYFFKTRDFHNGTSLIRLYGQWQYRPTEKLTLNSGIHSQLLALNNSYSIEPRVGLRYQIKKNQSISFGAGMHSQLQPITMYFTEQDAGNGQVLNGNKNLKFNKAIHTVIGYDLQFSKNVRLKTEIYYQSLYNIGVDRLSSSFSVLNVGADFTFPNNADLVNKGTGTNYGLEITLEKFLDKGFYFLFTSSLFNSKYKGSDGVERNTAFNGNYVFNALAGKEWKVGTNNSITFDVKATYAGGRWYTPVLLEQSALAHTEIRDKQRAYSEQYSPYIRFDAKVGYRMNFKRFAQSFSLDIRNVTNHQNIFIQSFNNRTNAMETRYQTGFFPVLLWNIWF
jgi:Carboxypeptidase regulatory-like domain